MTKQNKNSGFFEVLLTAIGGFSGAIIGYEQADLLGLFLGALILGAIGKWVGSLTDWLLKVIVLIVFLLLNTAVRQFIGEVIRAALLNGGT